MASFEWNLKKKNYGFSIMKDGEFAQVRELSTVSECSTTTVHSAGSATDYQQRPASNVDLYRCCYFGGQVNISINSLNQSRGSVNIHH